MEEKKTILDYEKAFDDYYTYWGKMNFYRGFIIDHFSAVEARIDRYLIDYFIPDKLKRTEFHEIIIDRLTFEAKRTSLKTLLDKKSKAEGFVKTKNNTYPHAKLLNDIRILNEERIRFAHYFMIDLSLADFTKSQLKQYVFGLAEFRDSVKIIWYTKEMFVKIIKLADSLSLELDKLLNDLKPT